MNIKRISIIIIIVITLAVYANTLLNSFTGDDYYIVCANNFIKSWSNFPLLLSKKYISISNDIIFNTYHAKDYGSGEVTYRPVVTLSYMIDYALWKLNPAGYHFTNILFHAFNAALVYIFILLLARSNLLALLASLIFAVHPINTEVVNSISAREDLFVTFFLLSAFILFLKYRGYSGVKKKIAYIVSCVSFLPALLSKETAIMFVPLIFLYDFILSGRRLKDIILDLKSRYLGFIAAALFYLYIYVFVFRPSYGFHSLYAGRTLYSHILTSLKVLAGYVTAFAAPFGIAITPPFYTPLTKTIFDAGMIASLIILVLLIGLAFRVYKYSKAASFGLAWFFIAILPTSNIIRLVNMFSYRYMYFPGIGLCLALAILLLKVAGSAPLKKISPYSQKIAMVLVVGGYMAVTIPQNISWRNDFTVGQSQIERYPKIADSYRSVSKFYFDRGHFKEAVNILNTSLKYRPDDVLAYIDLGVCYLNLGMLDDAAGNLEKAVTLRPNFTDAYYILGSVYLNKNEFSKAKDAFLKATQLDLAHADAYNNLAVAYTQLGEFQDAKQALENALRISPGHPYAQRNLEEIERYLAEEGNSK